MPMLMSMLILRTHKHFTTVMLNVVIGNQQCFKTGIFRKVRYYTVIRSDDH